MADDVVRDAERIVLGAMMLDPAIIDDVTTRLRTADFAELRHATIYAAIKTQHAAGAETSPVGILLALRAVKELQRVGGGPYLHELIAAVPTAANATWYADRVREAALVRAATADVARLSQIVQTGDLDKIDAERARLVETWTGPTDTTAAPGGRELDAFLGGELPPHDWLVPGLLERQDRIILTGAEGIGKSTLLRQVGVQLASGVHPFGGDDLGPLRVLLLDLENSERQVRRKLGSLRAAAGRRYGGGMVVEVRTEGLDLLTREDADWLLALAARHQPDLLITGPAYKMAGGDPTEETPARVVAAYFDRLRHEHGCAILLEAHTPHSSNGARRRPQRPYGASLWLRWPEFGIFLGDDGTLSHWRGPRDERDWPALLQRGGAWPWTVADRDRDQLWTAIREARAAAGRPLSQRDLVEKLDSSKGAIGRAIKEHQIEWDAYNGSTGVDTLWEGE